MTAPLNIQYQTFGQLSAIKRNGQDASGNAMWLCRCTCGRYHTVRASNLTRGLTKSCGCAKAKLISEVQKRRWSCK